MTEPIRVDSRIVHQLVRSYEMGSRMGMGMGGMGGMGGGGMTTGHCVHNPDGSYTMQP